RNTPCATVYSVMRSGLGLRLNALTRPRTRPTTAPIGQMPGATTHVAAPTTTSSASSPPVFMMTSSYVRRLVSAVVADGASYIWFSVAASAACAPYAPHWAPCGGVPYAGPWPCGGGVP